MPATPPQRPRTGALTRGRRATNWTRFVVERALILTSRAGVVLRAAGGGERRRAAAEIVCAATAGGETSRSRNKPAVAHDKPKVALLHDGSEDRKYAAQRVARTVRRL